MTIRSPKLGPSELSHNKAWYPYYAGFSTGFVEDVIEAISPRNDAVILDPWNGAGTTTLVSRNMGYSSIGLDVNPSLSVIAKGRLLDVDTLPSIPPLTADVIAKSESSKHKDGPSEGDLLGRWFVEESVVRFRTLERAVYELLVDRNKYIPVFQYKNLSDVSSLAAFFYVSLFLTARSFLGPFQTTNPTWIKTPKYADERLFVNHRLILSRFSESVELVKSLVLGTNSFTKPDVPIPQIYRANSESLPLRDQSVDIVISSPPYCTRIDYAVATLPELAVIGCAEGEDLRELRHAMIGTPTVRKTAQKTSSDWGEECLRFLQQVRGHSSKASETYYARYFVQYFYSLWLSLKELNRVIREGGTCSLVVQDSYYKEVHNDLPKIVTEMAGSCGWHLRERVDFPVTSTKASMHRVSRQYRDNFSATESLLIFST